MYNKISPIINSVTSISDKSIGKLNDLVDYINVKKGELISMYGTVFLHFTHIHKHTHTHTHTHTYIYIYIAEEDNPAHYQVKYSCSNCGSRF